MHRLDSEPRKLNACGFCYFPSRLAFCFYTFPGFESLWELSASCGEETRGRASSSQDAHISSVLPLRDTTGDNRRSAGSLLNP